MSNILGLPREALDRARRSRDPRFDGKFFIAVLSTGIYCRSICPVRLSSAVRYYTSAAEAAEAGFRPCLRCRPESAPGSPAWAGTSAVVRRALRLIQEGALDRDSVEDLAAHLGLGVRHLSRLLLEQVGASPLAIAQTRRLHFAKQLLNDTDLRITDIALAAGFRSVRRFNETIKATYKRCPRDLRNRRIRTEAASEEISLQLAYRTPFDWDHMLNFLACRAIPGVEHIDAGGYSRTVRTSVGYALIRVSSGENAHTLTMRVRGARPDDLFELSTAARRVFDLSADPDQVGDAFRDDPLLGGMFARHPGLRIPGVFDPFECAVCAILARHESLEDLRSLMARLLAVAGQPIDPPLGSLTHVFPAPGDLAELDLGNIGLKPARADAVRELARAVRCGRLRFNDPVEEVTLELGKIPGIDAWTAQLVALRGLADPDAFLPTDLVLRRMAKTHAVPLAARALEARAEQWRPWRGYAVMHLWAAANDVALRCRRINAPNAHIS